MCTNAISACVKSSLNQAWFRQMTIVTLVKMVLTYSPHPSRAGVVPGASSASALRSWSAVSAVPRVAPSARPEISLEI